MSSDLMESFYRREEMIMRALLRLQALQHNYRSVRLLTGECREMIYSYLRRQDEQFYAKMTEFYQDNRSALKMIEFLTVDIKEVRVATFAFFEQYGVANPLEQGRNFARDLRGYKQIVVERFRIEKDYLMPLLIKIQQDSNSWLASENFMKKINSVLFMLIISSFVGCAGFQEEAKLLWGSSTKALEEQRREALVETFVCPWDQCFTAVIQYANGEALQLSDENNRNSLKAHPSDETMLKAIQPTNLEVFLQDRDRRIIVLMGVPGSVRTTEVGVFFTLVDETQTRVEITSLSTLAKIRAADILFSHLGQKFKKIS